MEPPILSISFDKEQQILIDLLLDSMQATAQIVTLDKSKLENGHAKYTIEFRTHYDIYQFGFRYAESRILFK